MAAIHQAADQRLPIRSTDQVYRSGPPHIWLLCYEPVENRQKVLRCTGKSRRGIWRLNLCKVPGRKRKSKRVIQLECKPFEAKNFLLENSLLVLKKSWPNLVLRAWGRVLFSGLKVAFIAFQLGNQQHWILENFQKVFIILKLILWIHFFLKKEHHY